MMKLVVCDRTDKILGCHIVGDGASEMIQMFGISMKMGVKKKDLDSTCTRTSHNCRGDCYFKLKCSLEILLINHN